MSEPCEKGDLISGTPHLTMPSFSYERLAYHRSLQNMSESWSSNPHFIHASEYPFFEFWECFIWPQISAVAVHKGRSYVFELNSTYSLDSCSAGNETRYINHSSTPNCCCIGTSVFFLFLNIHWCRDAEFSDPLLVMLVNGEHRIGVYASTCTLHLYIIPKRQLNIPSLFTATKILEGEELFINYGPNFFPTPDTKEKEEEPEPIPSSSIQYAEDSSDSTSSCFKRSDSNSDSDSD